MLLYLSAKISKITGITAIVFGLILIERGGVTMVQFMSIRQIKKIMVQTKEGNARSPSWRCLKSLFNHKEHKVHTKAHKGSQRQQSV